MMTIHAILTDDLPSDHERKVADVPLTFANIGEYFTAWSHHVDPHTRLYSEQVGQCEMCNCLYLKENEVLGGRAGRSGFCSTACKSDVDDEIRYWDAESRINAICGDDFGPPDSDPYDIDRDGLGY